VRNWRGFVVCSDDAGCRRVTGVSGKPLTASRVTVVSSSATECGRGVDSVLAELTGKLVEVTDRLVLSCDQRVPAATLASVLAGVTLANEITDVKSTFRLMLLMLLLAMLLVVVRSTDDNCTSLTDTECRLPTLVCRLDNDSDVVRVCGLAGVA